MDLEYEINTTKPSRSTRSVVPASRNKCYNKKNLKKKYFSKRITNYQLLGVASTIKGSKLIGKPIAKSLGRKALARFLGGPITSIA